MRYLTGDRLFRLEYGEAHVAIRAGSAPDQPDNVVQPFITQEVGLYASKDYIERHGKPSGIDEFAGHHFVGTDDENSRAPFSRWLRGAVPAEQITFRCTNNFCIREAVLSGAGIGFMARWEAARDPNLIEVIPPMPEWFGNLWLVTHVDLHRTTKVQAFLTFLKETIQRLVAVSPQARGHLAMLAFSALVAGSFSLGAQIANQITPEAITAARFAIASVVIGGAALVTTGLPRSAAHAPWRYLVLGGLFATYFVLMFHGLKTAPPVSAAAVFTLTPIMSAIAGWVLLRQITTPRMAFALTVGAAGALWVIFRADWQALTTFEIGGGEVIYFWGCVAHAIYTPMVRKLNRGEPAVVFTFGTLVAGCILLTMYGWSDLRATDWANLPMMVWIGLFYVSIFATATSFVLVQFATLRLPSAKVMAYTYLTPSWVILWEVALGQPAPALLVGFGAVLTVVALVLLLKTDDQPRSVPNPQIE